MTSAVAGRSPDFGPEDYDAIERAVMETPRGRWFLAQRDQRQRVGETQRILDAMKKLEGVLAAIPVQPAPANGGEAPAPALAADTVAQALSMKNLKYFKQDEAVFTPAEPAASKLAAVETAKPAAVPKPAEAPPVARGARLIVNRISPAVIGVPAAAAPAAEVKPAESETLPPSTVEPGDKRRIVIIRRAATEAMDIPLQSELAATPAS